jgi:hypothetical protein
MNLRYISLTGTFLVPIEYKYKEIKERSPEAKEFIKVFINNKIRKNLTKE